MLNATEHYEEDQLIIADVGLGIKANIADNITELAVKSSQRTGFGLSVVKPLCKHQGWGLELTTGTETRVL